MCILTTKNYYAINRFIFYYWKIALLILFIMLNCRDNNIPGASFQLHRHSGVEGVAWSSIIAGIPCIIMIYVIYLNVYNKSLPVTDTRQRYPQFIILKWEIKYQQDGFKTMSHIPLSIVHKRRFVLSCHGIILHLIRYSILRKLGLNCKKLALLNFKYYSKVSCSSLYFKNKYSVSLFVLHILINRQGHCSAPMYSPLWCLIYMYLNSFRFCTLWCYSVWNMKQIIVIILEFKNR